ncbi:MAG TPA: sulfite exporter TauE/SafE family protein [Anaerolineae bacterium]|nr:sulfite exporter TauE/SafE family protein [Anaerolineae bacterium]
MLLAGFAAQFIDGTLGMGYGVSSTSLLVAIGLAPAIVSASVHTAEIVTTLVSGIAHHQLGNVKRELVISLAFPGIIGGVLGAYFLSSIPGQTIRPWVAGLLLVMGCLIVCRFFTWTERGVAGKRLSRPKMSLLGLVAGFLDAVGGGGWGPVATPSLILAENDQPHEVVGSVNLVEFFVTAAETITFALTIGLRAFRWDIVAALLVGGVIAAPAAAWVCKKLPHRVMGILIGVLLILLNTRTLVLTFVK